MTRKQRWRKRQRIRRRESVFITVMAGCAVLMATCLVIGEINKIALREFEEQSKEFNERMETVERKRETSGQNALIEAAIEWSKRQEENKK